MRELGVLVLGVRSLELRVRSEKYKAIKLEVEISGQIFPKMEFSLPFYPNSQRESRRYEYRRHLNNS